MSLRCRIYHPLFFCFFEHCRTGAAKARLLISDALLLVCQALTSGIKKVKPNESFKKKTLSHLLVVVER